MSVLRQQHDHPEGQHEEDERLHPHHLDQHQRHHVPDGVHGALHGPQRVVQEGLLLLSLLRHVPDDGGEVPPGLPEGEGYLTVLLQYLALHAEGRVLLRLELPVIFEGHLQLLDGGARRFRQLGDGALRAPLPQLALEEVADVARVGEELGVSGERLPAHAGRAVLRARLLGTRVRGTPGLLQVAVGEG